MLRRFRCVQIFLKHAPNRWCGKKSLWICYCCMVRWQHSYISYIISTLFNCVEPRTLSLFCLVSLHGDKCKCTMCVCVCVCVFFPSILDIKFVGRTSRGHTGGRSHRIFNPPSFCGACLDFCREKDSAIPFPRRP